ncbi:MAG: AraC family transcriptional regulator [Nevskiales bacterium]|nr:AraC family transcriptional regulator [Nevskiales bacterium]
MTASSDRPVGDTAVGDAAARRSIVSVQLLVRLAQDYGVDGRTCLQHTGLSSDDLADAHRLIDPAQELQVATNLVRALPDHPTLGLEAGKRYHLGIYGVRGFALATAPTPRALADIALGYLDLSFAFVRFKLALDQGTASVTLDDQAIPAPVRPFMLQRDFAAMVNALTEVMPAARPFQRIDLALASPQDTTAYEALCGQRPHFGQPRHRITFMDGFLDQALPRGDALIARACEDHCRRLLDRQRQRNGLAAQVRDRLLRTPHRMPSLVRVAEELHLSERSLRRHLQAEDTCFSALADEVRKALAIELLTKAGLKLDEIAGRLGYADAGSFIHAFKRWTGESPTQFRRQFWKD